MERNIERYAGRFWNFWEQGLDQFDREVNRILDSAPIRYGAKTKTEPNLTTYELAVPGYSKDQIKIKVSPNQIFIDAKKGEKEKEQTRQYQFDLPAYAVLDQIEATCADGLLTIRVPTKAEVELVRYITVK